MRTIDSRTYTNVALTVLILLLLALVVRPYVSLPGAYARSEVAMGSNSSSDGDSTTRAALLKDPYSQVVTALNAVAESNKDIAAAIRETAQSQDGVARAIQGLSAPGAPTPGAAK